MSTHCIEHQELAKSINERNKQNSYLPVNAETKFHVCMTKRKQFGYKNAIFKSTNMMRRYSISTAFGNCTGGSCRMVLKIIVAMILAIYHAICRQPLDLPIDNLASQDFLEWIGLRSRRTRATGAATAWGKCSCLALSTSSVCNS